jgi:integrase
VLMTGGLPWTIQTIGGTAKHLPDVKKQRTVYSSNVTAVVRLLLLTACRLGEILTLRWEMVDLERGFLFLPDSKTGTKHVVLNRSAANVLASLPKVGPYVVPGDDPSRPRHDLKKPWQHIRQQADIEDVHLHDLRHTHASIGAGAGLSLPVIGKLLGHASTQTTQRYAHLADNPVRDGAEMIGEHLDRAMGVNANT